MSVDRLRRAIDEARSQCVDDELIPIAEEKLRRIEAERADASRVLESALSRRGEAESAKGDAELLQHAEVALQHTKEVGADSYSARSKGCVAVWRQNNKTLWARELGTMKFERAREAKEKQEEIQKLRSSRRGWAGLFVSR